MWPGQGEDLPLGSYFAYDLSLPSTLNCCSFIAIRLVSIVWTQPFLGWVAGSYLDQVGWVVRLAYLEFGLRRSLSSIRPNLVLIVISHFTFGYLDFDLKNLPIWSWVIVGTDFGIDLIYRNMSMGNVALCFLENHYYSTKDTHIHTYLSLIHI